MSRIKEFYHEEIIAMQREEFVDDSMSDESTNAQIAEFDREEEEINRSGVPKHFHSQF